MSIAAGGFGSLEVILSNIFLVGTAAQCPYYGVQYEVFISRSPVRIDMTVRKINVNMFHAFCNKERWVRHDRCRQPALQSQEMGGYLLFQ